MFKLVIIFISIALLSLQQLASAGDNPFQWANKFISNHKKISSGYREINNWLVENVPEKEPGLNMLAATRYFNANQATMKPKVLDSWKMFLELKDISASNICTPESVSIIQSNIRASNVELGLIEEQPLRVQKIIEQAALQHVQTCFDHYNKIIDAQVITRPDWNVVKVLMNEFKIRFRDGDEIMKPSTDEAKSLFKGARTGHPIKAAEAVIATIRQIDHLKDSIKVEVNERNGKKEVDELQLRHAVDKLIDTCKCLARDLEPVAISIELDVVFAGAKISVESSKMTDVWLAYKFCRNFKQRKSSPLVRAVIRVLSSNPQ